MISVRRWAVAVIPFVYLLYLPVQSLFLGKFLERNLEITALGLYLLAGAPTLLAYKGIRIPIWQALVNLGTSLLIPLLVLEQRNIVNDQNIAGWMVMGVTVILTATAVRQHSLIALAGLVGLLTQMGNAYGPPGFISYGLVGAIVFVLAGVGVSSGIRRANRESDRYLEQQTNSLARIASIEAAESARKERLQQVLSSAVPMLEVIAKSTDPLSEEQKEQARLLELSLRDEIRGKGLLTESLREEISRLRRLGVQVAVLDDGGMDDLSSDEKNELIAKAIKELQIVTSGRVTLRSPKGESFRLTVVASLPGQAAPVLNIKL